jgi:hypothetical protein
MRRYIDMVRRQPNNPHAIYIACKYLQPGDLKQFIAMVGVPLDPKALENGWAEYQDVKERGWLPCIG